MSERTQITRREVLAGAAAAGLSLLSPGSVAEERQPANSTAHSRQPNIVYIVADDLGWADVGYHHLSPIRTPNIDKLVSEGVELDRFYGCPVCSPSRACLMTGRSPMRYSMIYCVVRPWATYGVPPDERVLPEAFHDAGYQTWMVGKWHLGQWNRKLVPNQRGFDHFYGFLTGAIDYFKHTRYGGVDWQRNGKTLVQQGYSTDLFADEAVNLIQNRDRSRPFFLYLPFNAPHGPLEAPAELIQTYSGIRDRKRRTYAAMVTSLDAAIGRVVKALEASGASQNTILLFHGDNGGQTHKGAVNLPLRAGKSTCFEGGIRVPAFLHAPGRIAGRQRSEQVLTNLDVFPTLAAAAGITPGNTLPFDGRNMWPALNSGKRMPREDLFFAIGERGVWAHAIFHGPWKLVLEKRQADQRQNEAESSENAFLFRIEEDPYEHHNLAPGHPEVVMDLTARIRAWGRLHPPGDILASSKRPPGFIPPKEWAHCSIV